MKLIFRTLLLGVILFFLPSYFPWWSLVAISFVVGFLIPGPGINAFISGFLGGGISWLLLAWRIDSATSSYLSEKMVGFFPFSDATYLIILAGLIGAIASGTSTLTGNSLRQIFIRKPQRSMYS